jgi:hypothetical protein
MTRPNWFRKINCLNSFVNSIKHAKKKIDRVIFLHDGPIGRMHENIPKEFEIETINFKDNLLSMIRAVEVAEMLTGDIYFVEDDYLHKTESVLKIAYALDNLLLVSGYDHPDRYTRDDDIEHEKRIIFDAASDHHWKIAESTCMTFAVKSHTFKRMTKVLKHFGIRDREFFRFLHNNRIPLWTSIPGLITQVDDRLSPGIDWQQLSEAYSSSSRSKEYT